MSSVKALRACGRFKVPVATPPSPPNRMSAASDIARLGTGPGPVALPVGDQITAVLDKEIGPVLQPVIVDAIGISSVEIADREAQREIVHRVVARLRRPSARGISSRSRGSLPR